MTRKKTYRPLKENQKEEVKEWLLKPTLFGKCPFQDYDHTLCKSWFPKITEKSCPCNEYSFAHVVGTAMKMME